MDTANAQPTDDDFVTPSDDVAPNAPKRPALNAKFVPPPVVVLHRNVSPKQAASAKSRRVVLRLLLAWIVLTALAALFNAPVAAWVHRSGLYAAIKSSRLVACIKFPGSFYFTLAVAILLTLHHAWKWRAGGLLCLCGAMAGLLYTLAKWSIGRTRPVSIIEGQGVLSPTPFGLHPFHNGLMGLIVAEKNQAFPSGHTCLAFATAAALAVWFPKWRWAIFLGAALVGIERILEGAHYPSDVVAGAGFGVIATYLTWRLCTQIFEQHES